ncbi:beta-galactosidase [Kribbella antibiotica]|uniref:Beta-galactosidase n=2 Tax=Kribbella antibiotica TaxID=190195 RepID=A0A4R4ZSG1_9ACTN|nr:beta-galactosidase [Kribbella antibiotica]
MDARGIEIDGRSQVVLCASLFYFRLPREQWRARLDQVRASGYTCVDVYLPWNFHELAPGRWDFEGRRDVAAFLDLAHEVGLSVIARPGPYICSEWDGGALPAWLGLDPELQVRQNEPRFLTQVAAWFDQVLPIVAARQHSAGGPVIMVQLENELDFFDCTDRPGYLTALRDLALGHGITVPLIACAGQGDLYGATGDVTGVVPACNFYPDDQSPHIEAEVRRYRELLAERGQPLLVTETNRRHRTLRRLLISGATLIAPYLQSSGWNFGYTPSTGNWGDPGNFMSHSYDFGGYVSSTGQERIEYAEGQVFARLIDVLGPRLAVATRTAPAVEVSTDFPTSSSIGALELQGGGQLIAVPNLGTVDGTAVVAGVPVQVAAGACPLMPVGLPLDSWSAHTLAFASADLVGATKGVLVFSSAVPVTVVVDDTTVVVAIGERVRAADLELVALPPAEAARLAGVQPDGVLDFAPEPAHEVGAMTTVTSVRRRPAIAPSAAAGTYELPPTLESLGVFRGRGDYSTTVDLTGVDELLVAGAADIVDLAIGGAVRPPLVTYGANRRIDVRDLTGPVPIQATVEIWGHANFDDTRLPALQLGALRGLGTVWKIRAVHDVSALWTVSGHWAGQPAPVRQLGGWSSTRGGERVTYTRLVHSPTIAALLLRDLHEPVFVRINGADPVSVSAENPWVLLPAGSSQVAVTLPHDPSRAGLGTELLTLAPVTGWTCTVQDDELLTAFAVSASPGLTVELPLKLEPGEEAWLDVELAASEIGYVLRFEGTQVRVTAWSGGECIGRVWLGDRPAFSGGDPDVLWIPAGWAGLTLLLRGVGGPTSPELRTLRLEPPTI